MNGIELTQDILQVTGAVAWTIVLGYGVALAFKALVEWGDRRIERDRLRGHYQGSLAVFEACARGDITPKEAAYILTRMQ